MHVNCRQAGRKCRRNDDLGLVTDRTGRVYGCTVIASSRGVRGRHSTCDLPSIPTSLPAGLHNDTSAPGSSTQPPLVPFRSRPHISSHLSHTHVPYEVYGYAHPRSQPPPAVYGPYLAPPTEDERVDDGDDDDDDNGEDAGDEEQHVPLEPVAFARKLLTGNFISVMSKISGSRDRRPEKARDVTAPTQRKRVKASDWEETGPAKGGPVDSELIPSYGGHLVAIIQSDLGLAFTDGGINEQELFDVATSLRSTLSRSDRAACYIQYFLASSLCTDKSGNIVASKLWPLVKDESWCGLTVDSKELAGCWSLLELMRLDRCRTDFRRFGIVGFFTWHGFIAYFDCVESYMPNSLGLGNVFLHTLSDLRRHTGPPTTGCTL
ncbi:hypothetical protein M9H77_09219 [Catharanthus roseus]|uniref:Uncharacterized protein n=1 Tax=Catharanthus roseus TaxID=4058 RepID=A0ACC0C0C5_CATRO|nr:hypothetical protein M9H77_09219 [Catharanthus roseus]